MSTIASPPAALKSATSAVAALTGKDGKVKFKTQWPGDTHQISVRGFKPGGRVVLRGGVFDIMLRENERD